ncbi:hypothetical protein VSR01_03935 [Actinacidiphila sp. DG2A-62]|uniref:hypothetical protein n=1 Tax=Actinacidiphila sp. DG2A-62 TaxID=3108821 RepID=UPI002DBE48C5|nr:hypothetical protein [Actinacidiphila sp. DG2A-62]MEC3992744.1 hypothetical protein [Actinacidiphila sp. DG2A-62]
MSAHAFGPDTPGPGASDEDRTASLLIRTWRCSDAGLCARLIRIDRRAPEAGTVLAGQEAIEAAVHLWLDQRRTDEPTRPDDWPPDPGP